jgi:DNA-binding Lrp family transcriptional regulator
MPVVREPYAPRRASSASPGEVLERLESLRERGGLRRVAAILFHRRAGFSANGMGVWEVPEAEILETGKRMAAFRGISHCYQRPTYADWPYSVFTMAHGRSKEECDAILDAIAERPASTSARRSTRAPSSRRCGCSTSPTTSALGSGARR